MQAAEKSAKKQAGQMGAWKSRKGYYAKGSEDTGEEPSILKKAISVGKKAAKIVGEKVSEYGKNEQENEKLKRELELEKKFHNPWQTTINDDYQKRIKEIKPPFPEIIFISGGRTCGKTQKTAGNG